MTSCAASIHFDYYDYGQYNKLLAMSDLFLSERYKWRRESTNQLAEKLPVTVFYVFFYSNWVN